jgi:transformer-2 protein
VTDRPHAPTPGEYMGHRRSSHRDSYYGRDSRDGRDRDYRDHRDGRDRDRGRGYSGYDKDRDRDPYGRDSRDRDRDWRRSPPPRRHSPDYRKRKSYSRSPPRGSSPSRARDFDGQNDSSRW